MSRLTALFVLLQTHTHIKKQLLEFALEKKEASDDEYLIDLPHAAGTERDVGLQAALDAAEAVLAELKSSFPDKQYQLMLQRTALCQERESTK